MRTLCHLPGDVEASARRYHALQKIVIRLSHVVQEVCAYRLEEGEEEFGERLGDAPGH